MKFLQVTTIDATIRSFLLPHLQELLVQRYQVDVACQDTGFKKEIEEAGFRVFPISFSRKFYSPKNLKAFFQVLNLLKRKKYDIVHTSTPVASFITRIAARLVRVPITIYTVHGFHFHKYGNPLANIFYFLLEKFAGYFTDVIITTNQEDYQVAKKMFKNKKIFKVNGVGINSEQWQKSKINRQVHEKIKKELGIDGNEKIVGMIAEFNPDKRHVDLIKAAEFIVKKRPNTKFILVGEGRLKKYCQRLVKEMKISLNFIFTGFRKDIPQILPILDVFVLPSIREGLPRSILEAMAMEVPVIATDIRGSREAVINGVNGILVPIKNPPVLSEAILKILSDTKTAQEMGERGRRMIKEKFDEKIILREQLEIFQQLINEKFHSKNNKTDI